MTAAVVIAGVRSGVGKTTIATGIMGALTQRGYQVQPFKAGPDYIDPSYHQLACGAPSRNLDTWLLPQTAIIELFHRASSRRQISVIEGVMGLFDGHSSLNEEGSTAQLAKILSTPVILVAEASSVARSIAAEILGFQLFDPQLRVAGVILNGISGPRHLEFCQPQIEATTGLPVLGYLPRRPEFTQPERHLGLIPTTEGTVAQQWYDSLTAQVEETIDLDRIAQIANSAQPPSAEPSLYPSERRPTQATLAIAMDKAFSFYYQDSLDLLSEWGIELISFSPLEDHCVPPGVSGIYLGGGFPELFAQQLSENHSMRQSLAEVVRRGAPVYAECGGLMYLGQSLSDMEGNQHPMVGVIPAVSSMSQKRLTLGYRELEARADTPILKPGQQVRGHEFHWSALEEHPDPALSVYRVINQDNRPEGFSVGSVRASYVHIHLGSDPSLAPRFVETCARYSRSVKI